MEFHRYIDLIFLLLYILLSLFIDVPAYRKHIVVIVGADPQVLESSVRPRPNYWAAAPDVQVPVQTARDFSAALPYPYGTSCGCTAAVRYMMYYPRACPAVHHAMSARRIMNYDMH
jgi:hypothetical protein